VLKLKNQETKKVAPRQDLTEVISQKVQEGERTAVQPWMNGKSGSSTGTSSNARSVIFSMYMAGKTLCTELLQVQTV
jgi:hypothetical protein